MGTVSCKYETPANTSCFRKSEHTTDHPFLIFQFKYVRGKHYVSHAPACHAMAQIMANSPVLQEIWDWGVHDVAKTLADGRMRGAVGSHFSW